VVGDSESRLASRLNPAMRVATGGESVTCTHFEAPHHTPSCILEYAIFNLKRKREREREREKVGLNIKNIRIASRTPSKDCRVLVDHRIAHEVREGNNLRNKDLCHEHGLVTARQTRRSEQLRQLEYPDRIHVEARDQPPLPRTPRHSTPATASRPHRSPYTASSCGRVSWPPRP
jgi:hypothetical protein